MMKTNNIVPSASFCYKIRGRQKRDTGTLQARDQNLPK